MNSICTASSGDDDQHVCAGEEGTNSVSSVSSCRGRHCRTTSSFCGSGRVARGSTTLIMGVHKNRYRCCFKRGRTPGAPCASVLIITMILSCHELVKEKKKKKVFGPAPLPSSGPGGQLSRAGVFCMAAVLLLYPRVHARHADDGIASAAVESSPELRSFLTLSF